MIAVGNLYSSTCIVLLSDGEIMNSALPAPLPASVVLYTRFNGSS